MVRSVYQPQEGSIDSSHYAGKALLKLKNENCRVTTLHMQVAVMQLRMPKQVAMIQLRMPESRNSSKRLIGAMVHPKSAFEGKGHILKHHCKDAGKAASQSPTSIAITGRCNEGPDHLF